ncbi:histone-lysine N-methyltransferase SETD7 [Lepeophtheirus salmonis]|nr:histone-lysine N-methyltransferase SETD7-like [Lepeophtheirus salmonis]
MWWSSCRSSWFLALITILLYLHPSQGYRYGYYSLCNLIPSKQTWQKNNGYQLQTWIKSVIPYPSKENDILAGFTSDSDYVSVTEVKSPSGLRWKAFGTKRLDGWLYGRMDFKWRFLSNETLYVFPDFKSAIIGTFTRDGDFVEGFESRITHYRCRDGVMELKYLKPKDNALLLKPFTPNTHSLSKTPLIRDPLEKRNVFLSNSVNIPALKNEDSLYAKRNMPPHSLVSYYNGYFIPSKIAYDNASDLYSAHKNSMAYSDIYLMNMPIDCADTKNYVATLGHKVNHHFWNNHVQFGYVKHPLYGEIRCLVSLKYVHRGQELFANYYYPLDQEETPDWYLEMYNKGVQKHPEIVLNI